MAKKKVQVKEAPPAETPNLIFRKTLQEKFIAGFDDPVAFCEDFLNFHPYQNEETGFGQADFLRKWRDTVDATFCAGNRVGKSFISGAILLYKAFYRHYSPHFEFQRTPFAQYTAMATSITQGQANIAFDYARQFAEQKYFRAFIDGDILKSPFPLMKIKTRLQNGDPAVSSVTARSIANNGVNLLGLSLSFLLNDENAFTVNYKEIEDTILRMRLADQGGSLLRISSPNGRNHFYELFNKYFDWHNQNSQKDPRYLSYRLRTIDNPWIIPAVIEEFRSQMMPELFQQNVMAEFVTLSDFFSASALQKLYDNWEILKQDGEFLPFRLPFGPFKSARYVMGVDLGFKRDCTVILVADASREPAPLVYTFELAHQPPDVVEAKIVEVYNQFQPELTFIDSTGVGMTFVEDTLIKKHDWSLDRVKPFVFSLPTKLDVLTRLQGAVYRQEYCFPYSNETRKLVEQMSFYTLDDKKLKQDWVMAFALLNYAREELVKRGALNYEINNSVRGINISQTGHGMPIEVGDDDWVISGKGTLLQYFNDGSIGTVFDSGESFNILGQTFVIDPDSKLVVPWEVLGGR